MAASRHLRPVLPISPNSTCTSLARAGVAHGDLSPYNLLWDGDLILIDVSQSVEQDHPLALEFLKRDLRNVNNYYRAAGVHVFKLRSFFDFVVDRAEDFCVDKQLQKLKAESLKHADSPEEEQQFMLNSIHRSLFDIPLDKLEEVIAGLLKDPDSHAYLKLIGLNKAKGLEDSAFAAEQADDGEGEEEADEESDDEGEEEEEDEQIGEVALEEEAEACDGEGGRPHIKELDGGSDTEDSDDSAGSYHSLEDSEEEDRDEDLSDDEAEEDSAQPAAGQQSDAAPAPQDKPQKQVEALKSRIADTLEKRSYALGDAIQGDSAEQGEAASAQKPQDPFEGLSKQERKKKVKEENRERRKHKLPKKEKKKLLKKSKH